MIRWMQWWFRRRGEAAGTCRYCRTEDVVECPRCEGRWLQQRCRHCTFGLVCPRHGSSWVH